MKIDGARTDKRRMRRNTGLGFALGHKIGLQDHLFAAKRVLLDGIIGKKRV